jgi:hypothetical protein
MEVLVSLEFRLYLIDYFEAFDLFFVLADKIIMSVFGHLTDQENIYQIIDNYLTYDERNEVEISIMLFIIFVTKLFFCKLFHRIGIMNLLDPLKPERIYRLDLRRNDHREWCKILVFLAVNEPVFSS